uniref:Transmembrane protein 222 n=1 Tax=Ovis aries TaxID=9940 RepID=A0AC11CBZ8_SHEEP
MALEPGSSAWSSRPGLLGHSRSQQPEEGLRGAQPGSTRGPGLVPHISCSGPWPGPLPTGLLGLASALQGRVLNCVGKVRERRKRYWKLDPAQVYASGPNAWDTAVHDASEEYKHRMHNLCCDNCHSHVALALNLMRYNNSTNWNMVTLCFFCLLYGKYVSVGAFVKTWLPFVLLLGIILTVSLVFNLR